MRWIGNKYVDADGRIVADVSYIGNCDGWDATGLDPGDHSPLGRFLTEPDAKRAVERWWNGREIELKLKEPA